MRIAIWASIYSTDDTTFQDRHFAISIDEPLPADITSEPRLIWVTASADETVIDTSVNPILLIEVFDLPAGSHYIEVGITAPPPYYWYVALAAGKKPLLSQWTKISNEDRLHIDFTTDNIGETGYPTVKFLPYDYTYVSYAALGEIDYNYYSPAITNWYGATTTFCGGGPEGFGMWAVNPNPGEQYKPNTLRYCGSPSGTNSEVGFAFIAQLVPSILEYLDYWVFPIFYKGIPIAFPFAINPMLTNNNGQLAKTDYLQLYAGHVENDAPTLSEFYNNGRSIAKISQWTRVTDDNVSIFFDQPTTCLDPNTPLPPDPTQHKVTLQNFNYRFEAGRNTPLDLSLGRRIYCHALITYTSDAPRNWAAYPFMRIPENPIHPLDAPLWAIGPNAAANAFESTPIVYITQQMLNQGYFTVEVGRMIPKNTGTKGDPPDFIVDETYKIPLQAVQAPNAKLQSLTLSKMPVMAKLQSLTLSKFTPPVTAKLQSLTLSKIGAPPPPPPQYATLTGRLMGLLGPVADAEITLNSYTTKTARDGSFTISGIIPGKYTLTAKPTKIMDEILYSALKTPLDLSAPTTYTRIFNMPVNMITLLATAGTITTATVAMAAKPKPKPAVW
jgi:hypothetical protein